MQRIDGLLHFHERRPLARKELQVVDHQKIGIAAATAKPGQSAAVESLQETRRELFGRKEERCCPRMQVSKPSADALEQVRFADAARTVNDQRRHLAGP